MFREIKTRSLAEVTEVKELQEYLASVTLDDLIKELRSQGVTQQAFAEAIGMSAQKLAAIKSSEKRNRYFHELGATKLACLWVLERFGQKK
jgi:DNA-binding transcriptional regulator YiaG